MQEQVQNASVDLGAGVDQVVELSNQFGPQIVRAVFLLVVVLLLTKYLGKLLGRALIRIGVPERRALLPVTGLHLLVLMVGALVVLNLMGFPARNLFRFLIGAAMAILAVYIILRPYLPGLPFKMGDVVSQGAVFGTVKRITFAHTMISHVDGTTVFVPNHKMLNEPLVNISTHPLRRADIEFAVSYDESLDKVREVVLGVLESDDWVLAEPAPVVVVKELEPSYRQMLARFWLSGDGFLGAKWAVCEAIDRALSEHEIELGVSRLELVLNRDPQESPGPTDA